MALSKGHPQLGPCVTGVNDNGVTRGCAEHEPVLAISSVQDGDRLGVAIGPEKGTPEGRHAVGPCRATASQRLGGVGHGIEIEWEIRVEEAGKQKIVIAAAPFLAMRNKLGASVRIGVSIPCAIVA